MPQPPNPGQGKPPDPYKPPLQSKREMGLFGKFMVFLVLAVIGVFAYLYFKHDRVPTLEEVKQEASRFGGALKDAGSKIGETLSSDPKTLPVNLKHRVEGSATHVLVELLPAYIEAFRQKYDKVQVVVPEYGFDITATRDKWPTIGTLVLPKILTTPTESCTITVVGITAEGKKSTEYSQSPK